jgi:hypothetical protein
MNIQGLIERYEKFKASKKKLTSVDLVLKDLRSLDEPEPLPFKLKDVVGRIRGFDPTTQTRWLNDILKELGGDYGSMKYRDGYEQGKLEGMLERDKATIPQYIADKIKYMKKYDYNIFDAMMATERDDKFYDWLFTDDNMDTFTIAWQYGYEVEAEKEEEKRYYIRLKIDDENYNYLNYIKHLSAWCLAGIKKDKKFRTEHTRKQLEDAGFGEVFNSTLFEVEEVE